MNIQDGDTLVLWNDSRVTAIGKPYVETSGLAPRTMIHIRFMISQGEMEMSVNVDSVVAIEGREIQLELF